MKKYITAIIIITTIILSGEIIVRSKGMVDFPLYDANSTIGYIPAANQSGSFLNKHNWQFNALHMGTTEFLPDTKTDLLLVGDSIVLGGNPLDQTERLGPQLEQVTAKKIWPISAGSWGLRNELSYLRSNPEVIKQVDAIVFVLNSADFAEASSWKCELTHPRTKPTLALWYLFNKYVHSFDACDVVPESLQVPLGNVWTELADFLKTSQLKPLYIIYPDKPELLDAELRSQHFTSNLEKLALMPGKYFLVANDKRWQASYYRDNIHPSAEGNTVLANIISDAINTASH